MAKKWRISFVGSGNVAWQLSQAFDRNGHTIHQIVSRNKDNARKLAQKFGSYYSDDLSQIYDQIDLLVLAVPDDMIAQIARDLRNFNMSVVHTSGSVPLRALAECGNDHGVFYPLQTFSKSGKMDFRELPIFVEGNSGAMSERLYALASDLSNVVTELDSERRRKLHLAAVMVNNFSNHLFNLSAKFLEKQDIKFEHLVPLIEQTVNGLKSKHPHEAQTGPAKRGDVETINSHLDLLQDDEELQQLYRLMSESIQKTHSNSTE